MKSRNRYFAGLIIVCLSLGIFAVAGYVIADDISQHDQQVMLEGAKKMVEGNKKAVDIMTKKGIKDPDLTASEKMMTDGYNMMTKGQSMMKGSTMAEGKEMVTKGANMMMDADKMTKACIEKHGMTKECSACIDECEAGAKEIKGVFQTYGLKGNWEGAR